MYSSLLYFINLINSQYVIDVMNVIDLLIHVESTWIDFLSISVSNLSKSHFKKLFELWLRCSCGAVSSCSFLMSLFKERSIVLFVLYHCTAISLSSGLKLINHCTAGGVIRCNEFFCWESPCLFLRLMQTFIYHRWGRVRFPRATCLPVSIRWDRPVTVDIGQMAPGLCVSAPHCQLDCHFYCSLRDRQLIRWGAQLQIIWCSFFSPILSHLYDCHLRAQPPSLLLSHFIFLLSHIHFHYQVFTF